MPGDTRTEAADSGVCLYSDEERDLPCGTIARCIQLADEDSARMRLSQGPRGASLVVTR